MAEAMGAKGLHVTSMQELEAALAVANETQGPVLIDLALDPAAMPRMHR